MEMKITLKGIESSAEGPCMVCTIADTAGTAPEAEIRIAIEGGGPVKYGPVGAVDQDMKSWLETRTLRDVLEAMPEKARTEALTAMRQFFLKEAEEQGEA